jgi:hypothetical protein
MSLGGSGIEAFEYTALPARVLFGFGTLTRAANELHSGDPILIFAMTGCSTLRLAFGRQLR